MNHYNVPMKSSFFARCPTGHICDWSDCLGGKSYSWHNVFVTARHKTTVEAIEQALDPRLHALQANPSTQSVLEAAFCERMAASARAIVDVTGLPPRVLLELGALFTICTELLILYEEGAILPELLLALKTEAYRDKEDLQQKVRNWTTSLVEEDIKVVKRMLLSKVERYAIWYHCTKPETPELIFPPPLSGGSSGADLVQRALVQLDCKQVSSLNTTVTKEHAMKRNLYLLDAPVQRATSTAGNPGSSSKNPEQAPQVSKPDVETPSAVVQNPISETIWEEIVHNPISKSIWEEIDTTVAFKALNGELAARYPRESLGIFYGKDHSLCSPCVAGALDDYGVVIRAPNPKDINAIVLLMAGLHAPATHAAANAVVDPFELKRLFANPKLKHVLGEVFFEGVFKVKRTYCPSDLGPLKWVYLEVLDKTNEGSPENDGKVSDIDLIPPPAGDRSISKKTHNRSGVAKKRVMKRLCDYHIEGNPPRVIPDKPLNFKELSIELEVPKGTLSGVFESVFDSYAEYVDMCDKDAKPERKQRFAEILLGYLAAVQKGANKLKP